ncbi:MAG: SRPBCC family protein [Pirellulaceae bacterium]
MSTMNLSTTVAAPLSQVFEAFADFSKADQTVESIVRIEMLTDGPVDVGTRFRETRIMFGREATEEMEVTAFERDRLVTVSANSCGSTFDSTFRFTPEGNNTRVDMEMITAPVTLMAKLMWPIGWMMKGTMKKMMQGDMDQVKAACEGSSLAGNAV